MTSSAAHRNTGRILARRSPAFQFYIDDYRGSRSVQRMTFAQRGMYVEMLVEQWDKGSLPDCPRACAELLGGTDEEWIAAWPVLRRKFVDRRTRVRTAIEVPVPADHDPARRIINLRLEACRRERAAYVKTKQNAGQKGGLSKAQKQQGLLSSKPVAVLESATAKRSPSSPSPTPSTSPTASATTTPSPVAAFPSPADARSKRPMFKGQRFVVFEWMLEDLRRMLGSHVEAFDLHAWFFELDERVAAQNVTVPQRDGGKWLQDQTLAEAIRRGIPVAAPAVSTGKTAGNLAAAAAFVARGRA